MMYRSLILVSVLFFAVPRTGFSQDAPTAPPDPPAPIPKNYFVPFLDIAAFDTLLNRFNYRFVDRGTYDVSISSIRRNANSPWVLDNDPFSINQFLHPYQGSTYHGLARSAGLNYWE